MKLDRNMDLSGRKSDVSDDTWKITPPPKKKKKKTNNNRQTNKKKNTQKN